MNFSHLFQRIFSLFRGQKKPESTLLRDNTLANQTALDVASGRLRPGSSPTPLAPSPSPKSAVITPATAATPPATAKPTPHATPDNQGFVSLKQIDPIVKQVAKKYGYNPKLLQAIIQTEAGVGDGLVNPRAYRFEPKLNDASYGLGQALGGTAKNLGLQGSPDQLYDPETSIDYIGRYLQDAQKNYPKSFTDPVEVYRLYNAGAPGKPFYPGAEEKFRSHYYGL